MRPEASNIFFRLYCTVLMCESACCTSNNIWGFFIRLGVVRLAVHTNHNPLKGGFCNEERGVSNVLPPRSLPRATAHESMLVFSFPVRGLHLLRRTGKKSPGSFDGVTITQHDTCCELVAPGNPCRAQQPLGIEEQRIYKLVGGFAPPLPFQGLCRHGADRLSRV